MSNNNPHGHISQPTQNPAWNHLQIPSYIPRQPQLAHMSNERPMVRSPSTWHAPAPPPESIYNFMSANHKNLEHQMNSLLPPFVRGPSPFDSMDLSLQSSRSAGSPLSKASHPPAMLQHEYGHKQVPPPPPTPPHQQQPQQHQQHQQSLQQQQQQQQQQQATQIHTSNNYPIHNLSTNSPSQMSHSQQQQQQQQQQQSQSQHAQLATMSSPVGSQHSHGGMQGISSSASALPPTASPAAGGTTAAPPTKYLNANGNDCENMLPPPVTAAAGAPVSGSGGNGNSNSSGNNNGAAVSAGPSPVHYMRDSNDERIGDNYAKVAHMQRSYEAELQSKGSQKPVELVSKDCNYSAMLSSKMPPHHQQQQQQQLSPKKHSPIRNYHTHQHHQQQQQQQQQSPYNNPPAGKHNGPHTPPTPQSPVLHHSGASSTQLHSGSNVLDYNQLHLQQQQQSQNAYPQHHQQQQQPLHQQQQQHMPPQHALHYTHPHTHHHHQLQQAQQQQQHQQHQQHHAPPHMHSQMHQQQQQQQKQQQHQPQPQPPAQHQQLAPHMHQQQPSPMHPTQQPPPPHHGNLTRLNESYAMSDEAKLPATHVEHASIADLSANSNAPPTSYKASAAPVCLPDSAESPSPDAASSNGESLDSNSNSSGCRQRHKHAAHKMAGGSLNDSETEDLSRAPQARTTPGQQQLQQMLTRSESGISRSPKASPEQQRHSPRKAENKSPASTCLEAAAPQSTMSADAINAGAPSGPHTPPSPTPVHELKTSPQVQTLENGRLPVPVSDDVETIDKISAMIAKTGGDANSNSSIKSDLELSGSPKTKKQRQALKLRNAEYNSNSNCSSNSYNNANVVANDNAVAAADDLHKEAAHISVVESGKRTHTGSVIETAGDGVGGVSMVNAAAVVRALSPQSCSRSSSSSSSSSSCSNTSRSSNGSKVPKSKARSEGAANTDTAAGVATAAADNMKKDNLREIDAKVPDNSRDVVDANADCVSNKKPPDEPLNNKKDIYFEEVENKLEEMFAGIEDEPAPRGREEATPKSPPHTAEVARDLSLALALSTGDAVEQQKQQQQNPSNDTAALHVRIDGPPPTKAAKKSTLPSPVKATPTPPASPLAAAQVSASLPVVTQRSTADAPTVQPTPPSNVTAALPKRVAPPRRRLSVVMDAANLRIALDDDDDMVVRNAGKRSKPVAKQHSKELIVSLVDDDYELPSTSAAAVAALAAKSGTISKETAASGGSSKSTSPKKGRQCHVNARKRGMSQAKQQRGAAAESNKANSRNAAGRYSVKGAKSQQHQRRKQPNSSDDETTTPPTREGSNAAATEPKYKSPFILVKRDGSVSVINAPLAAEDVHEKQTKAKKVNAVGYAHDRKNIRGLHSSTLSNKYDADTTDSTWICVFCKRGPHKMGLGDLFGPYLVSVNCEEYKTAVSAPDALDLDAVFVSKRRRMDMVQYSGRNLPVVPATRQPQQMSPRAAMAKKKKKSTDALTPTPANCTVSATTASSTIDTVVVDPLDCSADVTLQRTFAGMCKVSESSYEIWLHEDCTVWAPDVFLVGARVMGLDAAVWNSTRYHCVLCSKPGAIVCCLQRDCKAAAHVPCAREAHWCLNETNRMVHCQRHKAGTTTTVTTTTALLAAPPAAQHFVSLKAAPLLSLSKSTSAS